MFNRFFVVVLSAVYCSENQVTIADDNFFAVLWEEGDRMECGFFCDTKLAVEKETQSEAG